MAGRILPKTLTAHQTVVPPFPIPPCRSLTASHSCFPFRVYRFIALCQSVLCTICPNVPYPRLPRLSRVHTTSAHFVCFAWLKPLSTCAADLTPLNLCTFNQPTALFPSSGRGLYHPNRGLMQPQGGSLTGRHLGIIPIFNQLIGGGLEDGWTVAWHRPLSPTALCPPSARLPSFPYPLYSKPGVCRRGAHGSLNEVHYLFVDLPPSTTSFFCGNSSMDSPLFHPRIRS